MFAVCYVLHCLLGEPPAVFPALLSLGISLAAGYGLWRLSERNYQTYEIPGCVHYLLYWPFFMLDGFLIDLSQPHGPQAAGWSLLPMTLLYLPIAISGRYRLVPPNEDFRDVRRQPPFPEKGWRGKDDP